MFRTLSLRLVACLVLAVTSWGTSAQSRAPVQWAGFSYAGQHAQLRQMMPVIKELVDDDKQFQRALDTRIASAVKAERLSSPGIEFATDGLQLQGDDAYALSFVLAGESINVVKIEAATEASFELQVLLLVGNVSKDPTRQRVVSSYPLRMRHRAMYSDGRQPTRDDAKRIFTSMLMGDRADGCADLVDEWKRQLAKVKLRERDVWVAVSPLRFNAEALQQAGLSEAQAAALSFRATSLIEANLSRAADIPLVPSTFDQALEHLTLSFANSNVIAFRKPDPSYTYDLTIFGLRSFTAEQAMSREKKFLVSYGGGFQFDYFKIDANRQRSAEISVRLKSVQSVSYVGSTQDARRFDNAAMYSSLVMNFAEQLSTNLVPLNAKWLEQAKADSETQSVPELVRRMKKLAVASL